MVVKAGSKTNVCTTEILWKNWAAAPGCLLDFGRKNAKTF